MATGDDSDLLVGFSKLRQVESEACPKSQGEETIDPGIENGGTWLSLQSINFKTSRTELMLVGAGGSQERG